MQTNEEAAMTATPTPEAPTAGALALRELEPADADAAAAIVYDAFAGIHDRHRFPRDFPTLDAAAAVTSAFAAHPSIWGVVAEVDGRVVGSNFLDERGPIRGVGPISVAPDAARLLALGKDLKPHGLVAAEGPDLEVGDLGRDPAAAPDDPHHDLGDDAVTRLDQVAQLDRHAGPGLEQLEHVVAQPVDPPVHARDVAPEDVRLVALDEDDVRVEEAERRGELAAREVGVDAAQGLGVRVRHRTSVSRRLRGRESAHPPSPRRRSRRARRRSARGSPRRCRGCSPSS
jgi:hypothetical protein